jgi:hypothetical protein
VTIGNAFALKKVVTAPSTTGVHRKLVRSMLNLKRLAGWTADAAIVTLCLVAGYKYLYPAAAPQPPSVPMPAIGDTFGTVPGVDFSAQRRTVVLALRSQCRFCTASVPFYQTLRRQADSLDFKVVVVSGDTDPVIRGYVADHSLAPHYILGSSNMTRYRVSGTPTVFIINSDAKILGAWKGLLDAGGEADVLAMLSR